MAKETAKKGIFRRLGKFFVDVRSEFKKVVWPTKKQALKNTMVVLGVVLCVGIFVWALDFILGLLVSLFLGGKA